jgi:type I restriction enzyme, S subunit
MFITHYFIHTYVVGVMLFQNKTTGIRNLQLERYLDKVEIPLPTLSEQKAIVAKLDRAQRLIDIDREMLAKYDELIQSVFLEMFGDPVRNEKGLPRRKIKDIGKVVTGNTPPKKDPENYGNEIEWVKTTNIIDEQLYPTTSEEYLSKKGKKLGRIIPKNSLIVCCIAGSLSSIGKCSIVDREMAINQQINAIVPNPDMIDITFLYAQLMVGKKLIQDASTKSMKGMVSKSKFQKIELLVPKLSTQQRFSVFFDQVGKEKLKLRSESKKSEELFSSLVQGVFN